MPANRFNNFTTYAAGIGLRIPHYDHILTRKPTCDWFEIISENFMVDGGRPLQVLDQILEHYQSRPARRVHVLRLRGKTQSRTSPPPERISCAAPRLHGSPIIFAGAASTAATLTIFSPCRTRSKPRESPPQKIREVRDFLEVPIVVENVSSYAEYHVSEMTEWEFLNEVVERADCGILLDVNNIYVSSQNHSFDPAIYVEQRPR